MADAAPTSHPTRQAVRTRPPAVGGPARTAAGTLRDLARTAERLPSEDALRRIADLLQGAPGIGLLQGFAGIVEELPAMLDETARFVDSAPGAELLREVRDLVDDLPGAGLVSGAAGGAASAGRFLATSVVGRLNPRPWVVGGPVDGPPHHTGGFRRGDVRINGFRMAYLEAGPRDGPLALCLHGFPDHALTWMELMPALADAGYRAVAPWMRGYYPSDAPPGRHYQVGALSADAIALHEALDGGDDAVLIGHDWGAFAAYGAANGAPERWRRLVTMSVPPALAWLPQALTDPDQLRRWWYVAFFQLPWLPELWLAEHGRGGLERRWHTRIPHYREDPVFREALRRTFDRRASATVSESIGYYRALANPVVRAGRYRSLDLAAMRTPSQPTLFLLGDEDEEVAARWVETTGALLGEGSDAALVPGDHWFHLERPGDFAERVLGFLGPAGVGTQTAAGASGR
jgi:pimeloyl-ACP methyl ester carboxylesterase